MLKKPFPSFAQEIERQASSICSTLVLPDPGSTNFSFRLSRFPTEGIETVVDIHSSGKRLFISVSRFLKSLRKELHSLKNNPSCKLSIPVEISITELDRSEPILREIINDHIFDLSSDLSSNIDEGHFFIFFTDSYNCISSGISNPYEKLDEQWIRILNRSYGAELNPPRRNVANISVYK